MVVLQEEEKDYDVVVVTFSEGFVVIKTDDNSCRFFQ